jgi:hypothetical protein
MISYQTDLRQLIFPDGLRDNRKRRTNYILDYIAALLSCYQAQYAEAIPALTEHSKAVTFRDLRQYDNVVFL